MWSWPAFWGAVIGSIAGQLVVLAVRVWAAAWNSTRAWQRVNATIPYVGRKGTGKSIAGCTCGTSWPCAVHPYSVFGGAVITTENAQGDVERIRIRDPRGGARPFPTRRVR